MRTYCFTHFHLDCSDFNELVGFEVVEAMGGRQDVAAADQRRAAPFFRLARLFILVDRHGHPRPGSCLMQKQTNKQTNIARTDRVVSKMRMGGETFGRNLTADDAVAHDVRLAALEMGLVVGHSVVDFVRDLRRQAVALVLKRYETIVRNGSRISRGIRDPTGIIMLA